MKLNKLLLPFLSILLLCMACVEDKEAKQNRELIPGRWEIKEAFRNNKLTEALDGIYFNFKSNGTMVSNFNLSVKDTESPFSIVKNVLTEAGTEKRVYTIETLEPDNLILSTKYQGLSFRLRLVKVQE